MEPATPRVRPDLTHGDVVAWSLGVTLACSLVAQEVVLASPNAAHDLVILAGIQLPVYLAACALFAARRRGRTFEDLFALRRAPVALIVTGLLLGLALHAPAERLEELITKSFPLPKELAESMDARLVPRGPVHAVVLALIVAVIGPFVEELFYRGALFTGLRSTASATSAAITTGLMFTLVHLTPQVWLPIFVLAACLGYLRALSGSMWPGVFMHGAFNAASIGVSWVGPNVEARWLSPAVVAGSSVAALFLLALAALLAQKNALVERARALDRVHPTGDGATP